MVNKMKKSLIKWLAKIFGVPLEPPFEIVDNIDIFVRDKLNSMFKDAGSFDIATGYFQISGWKKFATSVDELLKKGGKVRLLIGLGEMNPEDRKVLEEAQTELKRKFPDIKDKIRLEIVPESGLIVEFEKPKIAGGCLYVS